MRLIPIFFYTMIFLAGCNSTTVEDLMKLDRDFSKRSTETGMKQAFLEFASDTAVLLQKNTMPVVGKTAIAKSYQVLVDTGFTLTWEPLAGDISKSGDLGYTYGIYTMVNRANKSSHKGKYVSIWKKQADGSWKWVLDVGNEGI